FDVAVLTLLEIGIGVGPRRGWIHLAALERFGEAGECLPSDSCVPDVTCKRHARRQIVWLAGRHEPAHDAGDDVIGNQRIAGGVLAKPAQLRFRRRAGGVSPLITSAVAGNWRVIRGLTPPARLAGNWRVIRGLTPPARLAGNWRVIRGLTP